MQEVENFIKEMQALDVDMDDVTNQIMNNVDDQDDTDIDIVD